MNRIRKIPQNVFLYKKNFKNTKNDKRYQNRKKEKIELKWFLGLRNTQFNKFALETNV